MSPYRTNAIVAKPGQEFGLIRAPKPPPPHSCNPPSMLYRLWMWIIGKSIEPESLWRCKCGKVMRFSGYNWYERTIRNWEAAGGYVSPQFRIEDSLQDEDDLDEEDDDEDDWDEEDDDEAY